VNGIIAIEVLGPAVVSTALGWIIPQRLAKIMPEGVGPLIGLACVSFVILLVLAGLMFWGLYVASGAMPVDASLAAALYQFGKAGLVSGIVWIPVMIISVANLPRHWTKEVW